MYINCWKITFSTVGLRLAQLIPKIVPPLESNSGFPTSNQHLTDRHSQQSVMISAWERPFFDTELFRL